jgi:hypothetical protein
MQENITNNAEISKRKKNPFIFVILIIILLSLIALAGYYYYKQKLEDKNKTSNTYQGSNQTESGESVFGGIVDGDRKKQAYIKQYNEYSIGSQGIPYVFQGFDRDSMSISLKPNVGGDLETYPLSDNFIIICVKFDPSKYRLDYKDSDDTKALIAEKSSNVSLEKKTYLLENYDVGNGVGVTFDTEQGVSKNVIKKLLIVNEDPWSCYEELE